MSDRATYEQETLVPTRKVQAGLYTGAMVVLLVWIGRQFGTELTPEVAGAIAVLLQGLASWIVKDWEQT